jgi:hypothetical protein
LEHQDCEAEGGHHADEFMMTALTGTSTDRKAIASITAVTPSTIAMIDGNRSIRSS